MRRAFLSLTAALLCGAGSAAAQEVGGRVLERGSGVPVPAAEVTLAGAAAIADSGGWWSLRRIPSGRHTLRVRRIGYAPERLELIVGDRDTSLVVELAPLALRLDEVVVTTARREQRLADVAVPTQIVSRTAIEETGASDLAAALVEQTGIQFEGGRPSGAGVMLQGLGSERVLVLVDGQPLYGRISGNLDLARIPTAIVERVEVSEGTSGDVVRVRGDGRRRECRHPSSGRRRARRERPGSRRERRPAGRWSER